MTKWYLTWRRTTETMGIENTRQKTTLCLLQHTQLGCNDRSNNVFGLKEFSDSEMADCTILLIRVIGYKRSVRMPALIQWHMIHDAHTSMFSILVLMMRLMVMQLLGHHHKSESGQRYPRKQTICYLFIHFLLSNPAQRYYNYFNYASYVGKKKKNCTFIIKNLYIYKKSSTFVRFLEN